MHPLQDEMCDEEDAMRAGPAVQQEEDLDPSEGPVPQIEIGPDGTIKINEKSLVRKL